MQLKKLNTLCLAEKLALAATALVGVSANAQNVTDDDWEFVGSVLVYSEPDRVSALEGIVTAEKTFGDTAKLKYKVVLDSLTGASANGAIAQRDVQTFTRPSGNGNYQIQAFDTPLDDTFKDTRAQLNVSWSDNWQPDWTYTLGTNLSREYDYHSLTINAEIAKSFDRKNTTLSAGISFGSDTIKPEGGRPLALSTMVVNQGQFTDQAAFDSAFDATRISGDGSLDTSELLLGWTQIVNRRMLMQFNYSFANMNGYLTDPFKVISVINAADGIVDKNIYENRPESRSQQTLFSMLKYHFEDSIGDMSYRYLTDDWDIVSHTFDFKWHVFSADNTYWQPHVRFYQQSAAEFYQPYLVNDPVANSFISADYRVGEMSAITLGLKYGFQLSGGNRMEVRGEYYNQTPKASGNQASAAVSDLELYPEVNAFAFQVTYFF